MFITYETKERKSYNDIKDGKDIILKVLERICECFTYPHLSLSDFEDMEICLLNPPSWKIFFKSTHLLEDSLSFKNL
jgi:hypothetical protein